MIEYKHILSILFSQSASGTGLAFIVFSEAVLKMSGSQVWAVLFFVMLFSLGLSTMFGTMEGIFTPIRDLKLVPKWIPSELVPGVQCTNAICCSSTQLDILRVMTDCIMTLQTSVGVSIHLCMAPS
jgi:SNF family Na+-dependent transporter